MLVIREAQIDDLQECADEKFVQRIMKHLREEQDAETYELDDPELRRRVKIGIKKARSYALTAERPIVFFVQLMFAIAPNFDEQAKINSILKEDHEEPNQKMSYLLKNSADEDWDYAAADYDDAVWEKA